MTFKKSFHLLYGTVRSTTYFFPPQKYEWNKVKNSTLERNMLYNWPLFLKQVTKQKTRQFTLLTVL